MAICCLINVKTDSHWRGKRKSRRWSWRGGKGKKYKDPWVLLHRETAIYIGGTTAKEWQASVYLEPHCTYKQTHTYAYRIHFFFFSFFFSKFFIFKQILLPREHTQSKTPSRPKTIVRAMGWGIAERQKEGKGVWLSVGRCIAWKKIWHGSVYIR